MHHHIILERISDCNLGKILEGMLKTFKRIIRRISLGIFPKTPELIFEAIFGEILGDILGRIFGGIYERITQVFSE